MSVTNIKDRFTDRKVMAYRSLQGSGNPIGDTTLADDTKYPVGSEYLDTATNYSYIKVSAGTWAIKPGIVVSGAGAPAGTLLTGTSNYPVGTMYINTTSPGAIYVRVATAGVLADWKSVATA